MANFASRMGMILATAGAAVGLGNIWRFPTTAGENGGAAFMLFYILCTLVLGLPGIISEFIVGRSGGRNAFDSYAKAGGGKAWGMLGIIGAICTQMILGFYSVVAGWCMYYFFMALTDNVLGDREFMSQTFNNLMSNPWLPSVLSVTFILLTHLIVVRGVQRGIERAAKVLMPVLFLMLLALIAASCSLEGAMEGVRFLFKPDFSKLTADVMFEAIGQSFFSINIGTATVCTYAAYFRRKDNLTTSAVQVVGIDTMVAIMAGLMIFPAAFAVGLRPDAGPGLIFQTLPYVFNEAFPHGVAYVVSVLFFFLLNLAALTSTIAMHETGTAIFSEKLGADRKKTAWLETMVCVAIGIISALSMGPLPMGLLGMTAFDNFDTFTSNILMPCGAFFTLIIVGWRMPRNKVLSELTSDGLYPWKAWAYNVFMFFVRFVAPLGILLIFLRKWGII